MLISNSPIQNWDIDYEFLQNLVSLAQDQDAVSFDVFDTALTRKIDSPADAFAEMEHQLVEHLGEEAKGFASAREAAERGARDRLFRLKGSEEIALDDIYAELPHHMPDFAPHLAEAKLKEIAVEQQLCVGVPDILEAVKLLQDKGKVVLFVSDMYLPTTSIADLLRRAGFEGWTDLIVSSETGATKASGRQWEVVRKRHPNLRGILHVGDSLHSDVETPKRHGIATLHYTRARSELRVGAPLNPDLLPFSYAQRASVLQARRQPVQTPNNDRAWRDVGRVMGAIVVGSFVKFLADRVRREQIDRLYFCARDGWLIQRAWKAAGLDRATGVEDHYLYISRRPLNLARGYLGSTPQRLDQSLLTFLSSTDSTTTVRLALERVGLQEHPLIIAAMTREFGSLETPLLWPSGTEKFERVLQAHAAEVYSALHEAYKATIGYLHQEGVNPSSRLAMVDLGWHGTMQRSIRTVVEAVDGPISLCGFYYGLWPAATGNRYAAGWMEPAFTSDFLPLNKQQAVQSSVDILEELHSAPHGTTVSYRQDDCGRWQPVLADSPAEFHQYESITRHFQDGVVETVAELFTTGRSGTLRFEDLQPKTVRATLGAVCISPTREELRLLSLLGHCATFDHASFEPLISTSCPPTTDAMWTAYWRSGWRPGLIKAWYDNAPPESCCQVKAFAHETLRDIGERALRQFA